MQTRESLPSSLSPGTLLGGAVALAAGVGLVAFLVPVLYRQRESDLRVERGWAATPAETRQTRAAQQDRLAHYAWIDRSKGVVALPIERAMELVLPELQPKAGGKEQGR